MKQLSFSLIMLVLLAIVIELAAQATYYTLYGSRYRVATFSVDTGVNFVAPERIKVKEHPNPNLKRSALHPYLGYLPNRKATGSHGFPAKFSPTSPAGENVKTILLTGGSVAWQTFRGGIEQTFNQRLAEQGGPRVRVFPVLGGGFKQPQQLQSLSYFLSLGAKFDLVVNLDGFNELVLPYADNGRWGVYPFYPRLWRPRLALRGNELDVSSIGEISYLRRQQQELIHWLENFPLRDSAITGLVARHKITDNLTAVQRIEQELAEDQASRKEYDLELNGPRFDLEGEDQIVAESIEVWARSSVLMQRLARANQIEYYHFLQPNQYLAGSKPFSPEEVKNFIDLNDRYGRVASAAYGDLVKKGAYLRERNINYYDLTRIFENTPQTVYRDTCCHFNEIGVAALIKEIVDKVTAKSEVLKPAAPPNK